MPAQAYVAQMLSTLAVGLVMYYVIGGPISWVQDNLPGLHNLLGDLPLIVANYRYPVGSQPALPGGWNAAAAWQHVAGEKVESDRLYWARYRTRSGRHLDESIVLESGLTVFCGA